jgi:hypothetical protein
VLGPFRSYQSRGSADGPVCFVSTKCSGRQDGSCGSRISPDVLEDPALGCLRTYARAAEQRSAMFLALLSCRIATAPVYAPRTTTKHCRARPALRWLHLSKSVSCARRDIASEEKRKSVCLVAAIPWAVRCRDCRHESISRGTRVGLLLGKRCKVLYFC